MKFPSIDLLNKIGNGKSLQLPDQNFIDKVINEHLAGKTAVA
jgi:hypothetical protein